MVYKLNPEVKMICSPITIKFESSDKVLFFENGRALAEADFDKNYFIDSVAAKDCSIEIMIRKNNMIVNAVNWVGEEAVRF